MSDVVTVKVGSEKPTSPRKDAGVSTAEREKVELSGRKEFFQLRQKWSNWIIFWISALIVFNVAITLMVGYGAVNFEKYQWFITAVTVETFLQVIGLGYVAVKFLFSSG